MASNERLGTFCVRFHRHGSALVSRHHGMNPLHPRLSLISSESRPKALLQLGSVPYAPVQAPSRYRRLGNDHAILYRRTRRTSTLPFGCLQSTHLPSSLICQFTPCLSHGCLACPLRNSPCRTKLQGTSQGSTATTSLWASLYELWLRVERAAAVTVWVSVTVRTTQSMSCRQPVGWVQVRTNKPSKHAFPETPSGPDGDRLTDRTRLSSDLMPSLWHATAEDAVAASQMERRRLQGFLAATYLRMQDTIPVKIHGSRSSTASRALLLRPSARVCKFWPQ